MVCYVPGSPGIGAAKLKKRSARSPLKTQSNRRGKFTIDLAASASRVRHHCAVRRLKCLIQFCQDLRISDIRPFTVQFERFHFPAGMRELADCVCKFVLAARRWFQSRGEFENTWPKCVQTGVIPKGCCFARL